jgi:RNase H-like domain found in reverse transcriptase
MKNLNFRRPVNKSELRSFLGLVTYIGASLENLSDKTTLLRQMTEKNLRFFWGIDQKKAFKDLKNFIRDEVKERGFFQNDAETLPYTDASPNALRVMLVKLQVDSSSNDKKRKVITCVSKWLTSTKKRYPQTHKEAFAIVWALEKLHFYLLGRHFYNYTDHEPMEFIFKQKNVSDKRAMIRAEGWALRLSSYNYTLRHVSSGDNIADSLSRICKQEDEPYKEADAEYGLFAVEPSLEALHYHYQRSRISIDTAIQETACDEEYELIKSALSSDYW